MVGVLVFNRPPPMNPAVVAIRTYNSMMNLMDLVITDNIIKHVEKTIQGAVGTGVIGSAY